MSLPACASAAAPARPAECPESGSPISDLSPRMQAFLDDIRLGKNPETSDLRASRHSIASTLRALVKACRRRGWAEALTANSAEAMIADATAAGWTKGSIIGAKVHLRHYARLTGEGRDWLKASLPDRRPVAELLAGRHWSGLAAAAQALLDGGHPEAAIRITDEWLRHRATLWGALTEEAVRAFSTSSYRLQHLCFTLSLLDPGNPGNRIVEAVRRAARRRPKPRAAPVPKWNGLPERFRTELDALAARPAHRRPSQASLGGMCAALRRLVKSATARGLPEELDHETAAAFAEDRCRAAGRRRGRVSAPRPAVP